VSRYPLFFSHMDRARNWLGPKCVVMVLAWFLSTKADLLQPKYKVDFIRVFILGMLFIAKDGYTFVRVLDEVGPCHATDPRDKVFGLLGHNSALIRAEKKPIIPADYGRTKLEIYHEVAIRIFETLPDLELLSALQIPKMHVPAPARLFCHGSRHGSSRAFSIHAVARRRSV
jgi:hypothetical protein